MKYIVHICIVLILFSSCNSEFERSFYYSDGSKIEDSTTIKLITREMDSIKIPILKETRSLKIYTSIIKPTKTITIIDSVRNEYIENLKKENPERKDLIKKIPKDQLYAVQYMIVDNKTGKLIEWFGQEGYLLNKYHIMPPGGTQKFLSFLFALEKEYNSDDKYLAFTPSSDTIEITDENGKVVEKWYRDGSAKLKEIFSRDPGGEIPASPAKNYTYAEWRNFAVSKQLTIDVYSTNNMNVSMVQSNFMEIAELFMALRNRGVKKTFTFIEKIQDENGILIYSKKLSQKKVIDSKTNDEMLDLLNYNMNFGKGHFIAEKLGLNSEELVFSGRNQRKLNWILYSNEKHTIGIIVTARETIAGEDKRNNHSLKIDYLHRGPRLYLSILESIRSNLK